MSDPLGPSVFRVLVVMIIVIPLSVTLFFGFFALRKHTPLSYQCRRCGREFRRPPYRKFPTSCPRCHARDWSS